MDEAGVSAFQWKIMLISGMGFFADAYDLFRPSWTKDGPRNVAREKWPFSSGDALLFDPTFHPGWKPFQK